MKLFQPRNASEQLANVMRLPVAFLLASLMTITLFYIMQSLIDFGKSPVTADKSGRIVDFIRIKEDRVLMTKKRRAEPPSEPDQPPKVVQPKSTAKVEPDGWSTNFQAPVADVGLSNSLSFSSDGDYLPILKVQPNYPTRALQQGMYGWVLLEFTVDEIGRVIDPYVIDNCVDLWKSYKVGCSDNPGKMFDRSAVAAAAKFKYKPRVVDGHAIATSGVRHIITFELDEDS